MNTTTCLLIAALLFLLSGCDSDDGTGPVATTDSVLAFILNGSSYSNTAVELRDNARGVWLTESNGRFIAVLDGLAAFDGTSTRRVAATLTIPAAIPGSHAWIDAKGAVLSASGLFLDIHDQSGMTTYQAIEGSTLLSRVDGVGGQIEGQFSGTLRSSTDGSIVTVSGGTFSLTRLANQP